MHKGFPIRLHTDFFNRNLLGLKGVIWFTQSVKEKEKKKKAKQNTYRQIGPLKMKEREQLYEIDKSWGI